MTKHFKIQDSRFLFKLSHGFHCDFQKLKNGKPQQYVQAVIIMSVALVVFCNMHKRTEPCPG